VKIANQETLKRVITDIAERPFTDELVHAIHGALDDRPTDAWVCDAARRMARNLRDDWRNGVTADTACDLADYFSDIGPEKTGALYAWFASDVARNSVLCDEANDLYGTWEMLLECADDRKAFLADVPDMLSSMGRGQQHALEEIARALISYAVAIANARDVAADDSGSYCAPV
jgi:hypothetical protein